MNAHSTIAIDGALSWLRRSELWASLSDQTLRTVAAAMQPMTYGRGESIIRQGEPASRLYVLTSGEAEVRVRGSRTSQVTVAVLGEGACVGEMSLLSGDPTSADVVATGDCEAFALDRQAFEALVAANPALLREFVRIVSRRLRDTDAAVSAAHEKERELTQFLQEAKAEQYAELVGRLPVMRELERHIERLASTSVPVLVQGERGTGKELVARLIHFRGPRKDAPLLSTNCAHIAETPWGDQLLGLHHQAQATPGLPRAICYADLARGGTILLNGIDKLPRAIQDRLAAFLSGGPEMADCAQFDVRFIVTCRGDLADLGVGGQVSPALIQALSEHVVMMPPLRDRKRDIPDLAVHFQRKHARRLNKPVTRIHEQAMVKLVTHDYRLANVFELEEAIERAIILTDDDVIDAQTIFLGSPRTDQIWVVNLLHLPKPVLDRALRIFPSAFQVLGAALFAFILYECVWASGPGAGRLATTLVWAVGWPLMALSFFVAGRAWCAICPMGLSGVTSQRLVRARWRVPSWMRDHDRAIMMAGFFGIMWVEEISRMRQSPGATAALLLCITAGAVSTSLLFPRRTWCRHLCPLGGFASVCSTSGIVELRPTPDICSAKCKDHACYKGTGGTEGCPMFNHVMFVDSNQHCTLCLNCVRNCPNHSPQLNLRLPARELWERLDGRPDLGVFAMMLAGMLLALFLVRDCEQQSTGLLPALMHTHRFLFITGAMVLGGSLPLLTIWLSVRRLGASPDGLAAAQFWRRITAWVPVVSAGFVSYQIGFLPGFDILWATVGFYPVDSPVQSALSLPLLFVAQVVVLSGGLVCTLAALWAQREAGTAAGRGSWLRGQPVSLASVATYWAVLVLMMKPW